MNSTASPMRAALRRFVGLVLSCLFLSLGASAQVTVSGNVTFTGSLNSTNTNGLLTATSFSGSDIGAQINSAYAALPSSGGTIIIPAAATCYLFSTPIVLNTSGKFATIKGQGATSTCLQYTASTGTAMTVSMGVSISMAGVVEDLELKTTVADSTATGISVGPGNTCTECKIHRVMIDGFQILTSADTYAVEYIAVTMPNCSTAAGTIMFLLGNTNGDDTKIRGGVLGSGVGATNCSTFVKNTNGNPIWLSQVILANNGGTSTLFVDNTSGGGFHCDQCHWYNGPVGSPTNWFASSGATEIGHSVFEDAKTSGSPASFATQTNGQIIFANNFTTAYGGETTTQFVLLSGNSTATFTGNFNGTSASIPSLWNKRYTGVVNDVGNLNTALNPAYLSGLVANGTAAGLSGTGACATITTEVAGAWAGNATCTGTTGASTFVITPGSTATHSWFCWANDLTTAANILRQSSPLSPTACTIAGTVNANDVLTFGAVAY